MPHPEAPAHGARVADSTGECDAGAGLCLALIALACGVPGVLVFWPISILGILIGLIAIWLGFRDLRRGHRRAAMTVLLAGSIGTAVPAVVFGLCLVIGYRARTSLEDMVRLRMITRALIAYADENGGRLPRPDEDWRKLLVDGGHVSPEAFSSSRHRDGLPDYFYVPADTCTFEADQVLAYQRAGIHEGGGFVGYHDNHVSFLDEEEFERVISSLTLPDGTPWAPHERPEQDPAAHR